MECQCPKPLFRTDPLPERYLNRLLCRFGRIFWWFPPPCPETTPLLSAFVHLESIDIAAILDEVPTGIV